MNDSINENPGAPFITPALTFGFAAAVSLWCTWFVLHYPSLGALPLVRTIVLFAVLLFVFFLAGRAVGRARALRVGGAAGLISGLLCLLLVGSLRGGEVETALSDRPVSLLWSLVGLIGLSGLGGMIGALLGGGLRRPSSAHDVDSAGWLFRFALVTAAGTGALLIAGALVTSTESGMSVPDWPTTFDENMFLFPMDTQTHPRIFMEHAHRLFGALAGLTTITFMVMTIALDTRRWVKIMTVILTAVVIVQGLFGAFRVTENNAFLGIFHGILAQLFLGGIVGVAVVLSPAFRTGRAALTRTRADRRFRAITTGFLHTLIVQLILGASYRHLSAAGGDIAKGAMHAVFAHAGFAVVVAIFASAAGFLALGRSHAGDPISPALRRLGITTVASVTFQVMLGIAALVVVFTAESRPAVPTHEQLAEAPVVPLHEVLITTAHHANGALLMAMAAALWVWGQFASPRHPVPIETKATDPGGTPGNPA